MKKIITLITALFLLFLISCETPKYLMDHGLYDKAIQKACIKIKRNPDKYLKYIDVLKQSLEQSNRIDNDRIAFLSKDGQPDRWDEVFQIYSNLKNRQNIVMTLPQQFLSYINFSQVNYDSQIVIAKRNAAEYHYALALKKLETKDKLSAREAYYEFLRVRDYYPDYKDLNNLINQAKGLGMSYVIFQIKNNTNLIIPADFETELTKLSLYEINTEWTEFNTSKVNGRHYNYAIIVSLKNIFVSPEQVKETQCTDSKKVSDGFDYVLDKNGNVMKDSSGNDIKVPRFKTIYLYISQFEMHKEVKITANIDFYNLDNNQLMMGEPIYADNFFNYIWANARGDMDAACPQTIKLLQNQPAPFPPDGDMILNAGQILKNFVKDIIWKNKAVFY